MCINNNESISWFDELDSRAKWPLQKMCHARLPSTLADLEYDSLTGQCPLYGYCVHTQNGSCCVLSCCSCLTGVCVSAAPAHGHGEEGSLYEADSWAAIGAFLFGPDPSKALTPHPSASHKGKTHVKVLHCRPVCCCDRLDNHLDLCCSHTGLQLHV